MSEQSRPITHKRGRKLDRRALAAAIAAALRTGETMRTVAAQFGSTESTICKLRKREDFAAMVAAELDALLRESTDAVRAIESTAIEEAYHALRAEMRKPAGDVVGAARLVFEVAGRIRREGARFYGTQIGDRLTVGGDAADDALADDVARIAGLALDAAPMRRVRLALRGEVLPPGRTNGTNGAGT